MEKINTGLKKENIMKITKILDKFLASCVVLSFKTKNFHWNVVGENFLELHKYFEELYTQLDETIDLIAERIRILGQTPLHTLKDFLKNSFIDEELKVLKSKDMVESLLKDNEKICSEIRKSIKELDKLKDFSDEDILNDILEKHEKVCWILRALNSK